MVAVLTSTASAFAVQPSLGAITPYGFQRGTELKVQFAGARLGDTEEFLFYSPGLTATEIEKVNDNAVSAKITVAPDCRLGIHAVRLRTATGVSNLRTFTVGALPEVPEQEPNNDFEQPQPVALNSTVSGVIQNEDVDHFVVELQKGQRLVAEVEGIRLGNNTFFDPYLAILDANRFELARSDDAALLQQDGVCAIVAPADGRYIVQMRESAYGGNGECKYRVHVGTFPRPLAVLPAGGRPGETIEIRWLGDPAGVWTETRTLPAAEELGHELFAEDAAGIAPSPNVVRVIDLANTLEVEPNDGREQATGAVAPGALNGVIQQAGDADYYKFSARKGENYDIQVFARRTLRSPLDSVLIVQNAEGGTVASNDDSGGPDSYLRFSCPQDGEYFVLVHDLLRSGGEDYVYRIEIAPVRPALTMQLPEKEQYVPTTLTVPRGNRVAMMVSASRANFSGDLKIEIPDLPPGMSFEAPLMGSGLSSVPVLFHAQPDAARAGRLADLQGRPTDENLALVGHLQQRTMLVRGQNNRDVWGHDAERMAVALADEVPFSIEIVPPQVPVVRNGSLGLKVIARRQNDYQSAISVRLLYNPPGIGSSGSISIAEGQSEAVIPLTANSGAGIGKWPLVVTGRASFGGATVEVASQMADLEISDSFFNFAFQKAAGELGKQTAMVIQVEKKTDFPETARVELLGLPANTATQAEPVPLTGETTELVFPITIAENANPNTYKSLVCRATIERNGEQITHTLGTGELRIDKPLPPPKTGGEPPPAQAQPQPQAAQAPPAKPLSRLEQLRLQRKQAQEQETKSDGGG